MLPTSKNTPCYLCPFCEGVSPLHQTRDSARTGHLYNRHCVVCCVGFPAATDGLSEEIPLTHAASEAAEAGSGSLLAALSGEHCASSVRKKGNKGVRYVTSVPETPLVSRLVSLTASSLHGIVSRFKCTLLARVPCPKDIDWIELSCHRHVIVMSSSGHHPVIVVSSSCRHPTRYNAVASSCSCVAASC